jgi:hypothetical protein
MIVLNDDATREYAYGITILPKVAGTFRAPSAAGPKTQKREHH